MSFSFNVLKQSSQTSARLGKININGIEIDTPVFMPVGTKASVKALTPTMIEETESKIILANTYHLVLKPGLDILKIFGGVKKFMGWKGAMLTDSGGFQVFSLAKLRKINDEGVEFSSHIDGSKYFFTPRSVMEAEHIIGADMGEDKMKSYLDDGKFAAPRWLMYPELSRYTIGWRMGYGEFYWMNIPCETEE